MKQHVVKAIGAAVVGAATVLIGAHAAGAAPVAVEHLVPAHRAADDGLPTDQLMSGLLGASGLPSAGITPQWGEASVGLPISSKVLPWHGYCAPVPKELLPSGRFCLPVNGMNP